MSIESRFMGTSKYAQLARAYLLSITIWSALSLLTGWNYLVFDKSANLQSTLSDMLLLAESRGLAYALLTPPIFLIVQRYSSGSRPRLRYLIAYILGLGPFMITCSALRWLILPPYSPREQGFLSRASSSPLYLVKDGFADLIYIYIAIVLAAHAYGYFERIRKQELENSQFQEALAASELQALKMQLHPHFLFNTLHSISTLIDSDGNTAKAMIVRLSSLLRIALEHSGSDLIPLHEELKFVGEYLDIEQMRFGARLSVIWSVDPDTLQVLVPQLILQPLVENAIRHGIASSRESGWVEIATRLNPKGIELRISNSVGINRPAGIGLGLRNTKARLKHLYSNEACFSFAVDSGQTANVTMVLPMLGSQTLPVGTA